MRVAISSGHGLYIRGASGVLDEVNEARRVVDRVATLLRSAGVTAHVFHDNVSRTQSANIAAVVAAHNKLARDRDVSVHFNAFKKTDSPMGTEVLWLTQSKLASDTSAAIARAGGFINRGGKKRTDLGFLNRVAKPAILLEICFVDSTHDSNLYKKNFEAICRATAEVIGNVKLTTVTPPVPEPPPVVPPPPKPEPPTADNIVDVSVKIKGGVTVLVNHEAVGNVIDSPNRVYLTYEHEGDVILNVTGEDFMVDPEGPVVPQPSNRPTIRNGSRGTHVVTLQRALGLTADGIFGNITENSVKNFQRQHSLTADGVVGPLTWAALERVFNLPPYEPPQAPLSVAEVSGISNMAASTSAASFNWANRGRAPTGFIRGMAVSYACAVRGFHQRLPAFVNMARANTRDTDRDALAWMDQQFLDVGMPNAVAGLDTLRHVYVFMTGMGMRESSGRHCAGYHVGAGNQTSETAEAGLFQTSWNARVANQEVMRSLFDDYAAGAEGYLEVFKMGVTCDAASWRSWGSGDGLQFQDMAKGQPRFAVEFAGVSIRNLRKHYGPINRREVQIRPEVDEMLLQVQEMLHSLEVSA